MYERYKWIAFTKKEFQLIRDSIIQSDIKADDSLYHGILSKIKKVMQRFDEP